MTQDEIKASISDWKKKASNKSLPASAVTKINGIIADLESKLETVPEKKEVKAEKEPKKSVKESKTSPKIKATKEPKSEPKKGTTKIGDEEYDCNKALEEIKTRHASSKKAAMERAAAPEKSAATKDKEKIEKVHIAIEKQVENGKLTKKQIATLIQETKDLLKLLEKALKSI